MPGTLDRVVTCVAAQTNAGHRTHRGRSERTGRDSGRVGELYLPTPHRGKPQRHLALGGRCSAGLCVLRTTATTSTFEEFNDDRDSAQERAGMGRLLR